jgi:RNA polymerase sigma-70 factor, ECF subfamily
MLLMKRNSRRQLKNLRASVPSERKLDRMAQTNTSLIFRVRNVDDHESWREFVELYEPLLTNYIRARGLNINDANDVVQEIFVNLLRALPGFSLDRQKGRFRTWLYQITIHAVANHGRRTSSRNRAEDGFRQQFDEVDNQEPDREWIQAHRRRILEYVLPKIKEASQPKTWFCFEQHVLRGRAGTEIARDLGLTANAVCVNAARVLDKVRAMCEDYMEELDDD